MDEGLLNDLLECSVCLERLDTSSRVLPCQHTFCLKCLKVIVESHKELRCPECRVLVEVRVEELPPNVLLMRILEGMKNAPRKITTTRNRTGHSQASSILHQASRLDKQPPPHGRALYDFVSKEPGDLSFKKGETILLQKKLDTFWFHGECSGRTGLFPITYVQVVVPLPVATALCKALYDFRMSAPDEEGCLAFDKGAIITVHRRVDENWAEGRLEQRVGIFPIAFVEQNHAARMLMNSAPLNRPVPPIPEQPRPGHSEHRYHGQHPHRYQQMTLSTPTTGVQANYQNIATMSQSHPNYHAQAMVTPQQILVPQQVNPHVAAIGSLVSTVPRNLMEQQTKNSLDLIYHFTNVHNKSHQTIVQSVPRIGENYDRLRAAKLDNYTNPVQKAETTYQNMGPSVMRAQDHVPVTDFTNFSSDSSSSVNTPPGVVGSSSTTTPNTSSNTSTCESAEPSLPSSPDNNVERTSTVAPSNSVQNETETPDTQDSLNASIGVLSLNESSTATNTSLNVSLPPSESPKLIACNGSNPTQNQNETQDVTSSNEPSRLEVPSSSKNVRSSGPDSLLNFGLGLQAALSPSHREGNYMVSRGPREHHREREKRHSLTPSSYLQEKYTQNRHSAEILATSLLDTTERERPERDRDRPERERERRRRRSRSNERPLPAAYIALYPYKPQKPDELELKKGGIYTVTERCRDGWYKGCGERAARGGVFPGNYVAPLTAPPPARQRHEQSTPSKAVGPPAPDAPPRAASPHAAGPPVTYPWSAAVQPPQGTPRTEKAKDKTKTEKSSISTGVSLMKRLTAMKKCKSPPPVGYSMDNPVFEDGPGSSLAPHPAHVRQYKTKSVESKSQRVVHSRGDRSGSCPSQLLRALPAARLRHDRLHSRGSCEAEWGHRKSASLDVSRRDRPAPAKERFRCIVPYPPNSEYELELKLDDIVVVCKKRGDGWYKGTLQRTGRTGLFPASFVQSCPPDSH